MIQLQVINKIIETKDSNIIVQQGLTSDFFSEYTNEFTFIKSHLDQFGTVPDKETFFSTFPNCRNVVVDEPLDFLIDSLYDDKNQREIATSYNEIRKLSLTGNVKDQVVLIKELSEKLLNSSPAQSVDILQNTSNRYDEYLSKINNIDNYYIKTGFPELDEMIGGWDRNEELATIAARTNAGKSWILIKMAAASIMQGFRVGFYSGEMSENKVAYRLDTQISHLSNVGMMRGNREIQADYKDYLENLPNKFPGAACKILTPKMIGGFATVTNLRSFIEKEKLDILFVDQHSLLDDDRKAKNPVEKASNISKDLKNLQVLKKIPIITASQQNRTSTENGVGTEHIAQSDRIAQDSTTIIFFEQNKEQSVITMNLVKSRDAKNMKKLQYAFDFDRGLFTYIPEKADENDHFDDERIQNLKNEYDTYSEEVSPF